ncbi:hypothetical protein BDD14_6369 [Edaphobacter modestus]|uniref:Uncharacterized protein n=2 Tax=Edaphobacter modestus TaxID=388466 RepID=A0A4Q7Y150_9BACT|nr:hypothetical protein BDD14_6369 [Edaphobacter modestus]
MLAVDLLLLVLALWFAMRIVRTAQARAGASNEDDTITDFATVLVEPANAPQTAVQQERFAKVNAEEPSMVLSLLDQASNEDIYADPIDGVPFSMGEEIHTCRCGVGYRQESVEWIAENLSGRCVHCGSVMIFLPIVGVCR